MTTTPDWIVRAAREIHELLGNEPDVHPPADWSRCHYAQIIAYHFAETGIEDAIGGVLAKDADVASLNTLRLTFRRATKGGGT